MYPHARLRANVILNLQSKCLLANTSNTPIMFGTYLWRQICGNFWCCLLTSKAIQHHSLCARVMVRACRNVHPHSDNQGICYLPRRTTWALFVHTNKPGHCIRFWLPCLHSLALFIMTAHAIFCLCLCSSFQQLKCFAKGRNWNFWNQRKHEGVDVWMLWQIKSWIECDSLIRNTC